MVFLIFSKHIFHWSTYSLTQSPYISLSVPLLKDMWSSAPTVSLSRVFWFSRAIFLVASFRPLVSLLSALFSCTKFWIIHFSIRSSRFSSGSCFFVTFQCSVHPAYYLFLSLIIFNYFTALKNNQTIWLSIIMILIISIFYLFISTKK